MIGCNRKFLGKVLLLLAIVVLSGVAALGCYGVTIPVGWSGVAIGEDTLFFGTNEGKVVAVDTSGKLSWEGEILPETSAPATIGMMGCGAAAAPVAAIYGTPVMMEDLVYVGSYLKEGNQVRGKFYAFNFDEDELSWVYPRQEYLDGPVVGGAVVALGKVYFGCSDGKVYALDAATGNLAWDSPFQTGDKIWSTPAIDNGTLYIGSCDKKLYALNAADGSKKWEPYKTEGAIACTPLVYDNTIYIGSFDRHVYAVDATNGSLIWRSEVEAGSWFWARPVAYNSVIYAGCVDGKVYILDAEDGSELISAIPLGSLIHSSPVLVNSLVIIATENGRICSLDTSNNQIKELDDVGAVVYAPLSARDGVVYIHTQDQVVYALDVQAREELWHYSLGSK